MQLKAGKSKEAVKNATKSTAVKTSATVVTSEVTEPVVNSDGNLTEEIYENIDDDVQHMDELLDVT